MGAEYRYVGFAELAVKVKHHLSSAERAEEAIPIGFDILDYEIDRDRLNGMIAGMVSQTVDCCERILKSAGLTVKDVSRILMVGGTSRVPLVQEMVRRFADGTPVHADVKPDLAVAIGALEKSYEETWETFAQCKRAAERGNATAQCGLGYMYGTGKGVERDYEEAVKWYRRSAEQGNASAQCNLGDIHVWDGDAVCIAGDLVNDGTAEQFLELIKCIEDAAGEKAVFPVIGNHDIPNPSDSMEDAGTCFAYAADLGGLYNRNVGFAKLHGIKKRHDIPFVLKNKRSQNKKIIHQIV